MPEVRTAQSILHFEAFELDRRSGELRREGGNTLRLSEQPLRILILLLDHPQEVITREEIRKQLWPNDTIVEFEHSISAAINRLRQALGDSAENPHYIETLARRGYRWMVPVERMLPVARQDVAGSAGSQNLLGKKVSHYRILELLGGGGMGLVYKAEDIKLGRPVALKFISEELTKNPLALSRFEREARAASALQNPYICPIYEFGEEGGRPFIVMPLLEGETLSERILAAVNQASPISIDELLETGIQICEGLEAAHQKGIIHRDIKPANVFVTTHGQSKILDFGLAKLQAPIKIEDVARENKAQHPSSSATPITPISSDSNPNLSKTGQAMGTASYMSPEQVRGKEIDARTDLFSLGLVLYEMATSHRAFSGDTVSEVQQAILHQTPRPPQDLNPQLPHKLSEILTKTLEKDRSNRYRSAIELCSDLKDLRAKHGVVTAPKTSILRRVSKSAAALFSAVVLIACFAFLWFSRNPSLPAITNWVQLTNDGVPKLPSATDGPRLYFTRLVSESPSLAQVSTEGGEVGPVPLPIKSAMVWDISPNKSELLLTTTRLGSGFSLATTDAGGSPNTELWILPIAAGPPHRISNVFGHNACWSPDGEHIAYGNSTDLYFAKVDGTESRRLATLSELTFWCRFSPDGSHIRFSVDNWPKPLSLWEVTTAGTGLRRLRENACCGSWSSDGKFYFFQSDPDIWVMPGSSSNFDGIFSSAKRLTHGPLAASSPVPSVDGKKLFIVGTQTRGELSRYDSRSKSITPFLNGISAGEVNISRDGNWATYVTYPDQALWRSKVDGTERLQLTFPPAQASEPQWSPNGKQIVFTALPSRIVVIGSEGADAHELMPDEKSEIAGSATWAPDGKSVIFVRGNVFGTAIHRYDQNTRQSSKIPGSERMYSARLSPDGRYITAIRSSADSLMLYDVSLGTWSELAHGGNFDCNTWSRDGRFVFVKNRGGQQLVIERVRVADRKVEDLIRLKDPLNGWVSAGADDSLIFTQDYSTQEIYGLNLSSPRF